MFCKTIQNKYTPTVMVEVAGGGWFGYYVIDSTLHRVGLGRSPMIAENAKRDLNRFLVRSTKEWVKVFEALLCFTCGQGKSYYYNIYAKKIMCNMCGKSYG